MGRPAKGGRQLAASDIATFLAEEDAFDHGLGAEARQAQWDFSLTGDPELQERVRQLSLRRREHYGDRARFAQLSRWREAGAGGDDPLVGRQIDDLWRDYLSAQEDPATRDELVRLNAEQQGLFNRFRADFESRQWSENDLNDELAQTTDPTRARAVWEAAKQIGREAEAHALQMVRLRNQAARAQGFRDAYERGLALSEVDEARLFALLDALERASDAPFRAAKASLDAALAERFRIGVEDLRSWHYGDPFFQRPPRASGPDLDREFVDKDPEPLAIAACDSIGLDVRPILARSDLYPKPGKNQHAFCTWVKPDGSDVRVLCNLTRSHRWTSTLLHELGHALAAEHADRGLPDRLILWPNGIIAETESQTIERMASDARWFEEVVGVPAERAQALARALRERDRVAQLIMNRWSVVQAHFERALYADPDADLRSLWWELVERFQLIRRPEGRDAPDWAAKIHNANFPGNYYVYILGELVVSQMHKALVRDVGGLYGHGQAGSFLRERLFKLGGRHDWERTVDLATGQPIAVDAYVEEWFRS
jgi:peptidyl-dipeptidase A